MLGNKEICTIIESCASALPKNHISNLDLVAMGVDSSDEWIKQRTGIERRYIAKGEEETTAALAIRAAREALSLVDMDGKDLDMVVVATCSPTHLFPSVATQVQGALGMKKGFAFDVSAACSGFIYGLNIADNFFRGQKIQTALLIGVDSISRMIDWDDRSTAVLFGDGAAAVTLRRANGEDNHHAKINGTNLPRGILSTQIFSDGEYVDMLNAPGGAGMDGREKGFVYMDGPGVFRHAVEKISSAIEAVMDDTQITKDEIDWFVPHQANKRILDAVAKRIGLPSEKVVVTVQDHGNTSAASVPLALAQAICDGRVKNGDLIMMEAMGAGFTWGASLVRW